MIVAWFVCWIGLILVAMMAPTNIPLLVFCLCVWLYVLIAANVPHSHV